MQSEVKKRSRIETRLVFLREQTDRRVSFDLSTLQEIAPHFETAIERMNDNKYQFLPDPIHDRQGIPYCTDCYFKKICPMRYN